MCTDLDFEGWSIYDINQFVYFHDSNIIFCLYANNLKLLILGNRAMLFSLLVSHASDNYILKEKIIVIIIIIIIIIITIIKAKFIQINPIFYISSSFWNAPG